MRHGEADAHAATSDDRPLAPELEIHVLLPRALTCAERTSTRPERRSGNCHLPHYSPFAFPATSTVGICQASALGRRTPRQGTSPPTSPVSVPSSWLSRPTRPTTLFSVCRVVQTRLPNGADESPERSIAIGWVATTSPRTFRFTEPMSRCSA